MTPNQLIGIDTMITRDPHEVPGFTEIETDADKIYDLGLLNECKREYRDAYACYVAAHNLGNRKASYMLGTLYEWGFPIANIPKDLPLAVTYFLKAKELKHPRSYDRLGQIYEREKNYTKAIAEYELGVIEKSAQAALALGCLYSASDYMDLDKAGDYFQLAYKWGTSEAYGTQYQARVRLKEVQRVPYADIVDFDEEDGEKLYQLALNFLKNNKYPEALTCLEAGVKKNSHPCMNQLGVLYLDEQGGIKRDIVKARSLFLAALKFGDEGSIYYNLGTTYQVEKMPSKAKEYYEMAVCRQHFKSFIRLANYYQQDIYDIAADKYLEYYIAALVHSTSKSDLDSQNIESKLISLTKDTDKTYSDYACFALYLYYLKIETDVNKLPEQDKAAAKAKQLSNYQMILELGSEKDKSREYLSTDEFKRRYVMKEIVEALTLYDNKKSRDAIAKLQQVKTTDAVMNFWVASTLNSFKMSLHQFRDEASLNYPFVFKQAADMPLFRRILLTDVSETINKIYQTEKIQPMTLIKSLIEMYRLETEFRISSGDKEIAIYYFDQAIGMINLHPDLVMPNREATLQNLKFNQAKLKIELPEQETVGMEQLKLLAAENHLGAKMIIGMAKLDGIHGIRMDLTAALDQFEEIVEPALQDDDHISYILSIADAIIKLDLIAPEYKEQINKILFPMLKSAYLAENHATLYQSILTRLKNKGNKEQKDAVVEVEFNEYDKLILKKFNSFTASRYTSLPQNSGRFSDLFYTCINLALYENAGALTVFRSEIENAKNKLFKGEEKQFLLDITNERSSNYLTTLKKQYETSDPLCLMLLTKSDNNYIINTMVDDYFKDLLLVAEFPQSITNIIHMRKSRQVLALRKAREEAMAGVQIEVVSSKPAEELVIAPVASKAADMSLRASTDMPPATNGAASPATVLTLVPAPAASPAPFLTSASGSGSTPAPAPAPVIAPTAFATNHIILSEEKRLAARKLIYNKLLPRGSFFSLFTASDAVKTAVYDLAEQIEAYSYISDKDQFMLSLRETTAAMLHSDTALKDSIKKNYPDFFQTLLGNVFTKSNGTNKPKANGSGK